jgi:uncharacterized Tic20 family protein
MMVHLSTCVGFFLSISTAAGLVGPALVWLTTHRRDEFVARHAREALNWLTLVILMAGLAYEGRQVTYPAALPIVRRRRPLNRG